MALRYMHSLVIHMVVDHMDMVTDRNHLVDIVADRVDKLDTSTDLHHRYHSDTNHTHSRVHLDSRNRYHTHGTHSIDDMRYT